MPTVDEVKRLGNHLLEGCAAAESGYDKRGIYTSTDDMAW